MSLLLFASNGNSNSHRELFFLTSAKQHYEAHLTIECNEKCNSMLGQSELHADGEDDTRRLRGNSKSRKFLYKLLDLHTKKPYRDL